MSFLIKEELEHLYQVLEELERKNVEKNNRIEELKDEIEYIKKEKENLQKYIQEKVDEKVKIEFEAEAEIEELSRQYMELQSQTQSQSPSQIPKQNNFYFDFNLSKVTGALDSTSFFPSIVKGRIIPVKNNGEPSEELGNSKWTKKK
jgi:C1A family cysteine protease